ncbi:MAG: BACON domain-containing carbohydrate-binding protein [Rikenellaceae bacterium]
MKNNFKYAKVLAAACVVASSLLVGCQAEEETIKSVDLRYEAEDEYNITALSPDPITIRVRSSDAWEVYSDNPDWCTITPSSGEAQPEYDPDENYDVVIQYSENAVLDDREDVIYIKSDYWIGKEVRIVQSGTAYLNVDLTLSEMITKTGGGTSFEVLTNQDWSAAVTDGDNWLAITSGATGSLDGVVTVESEENKGELRVGQVTIYDRLGVAKQVVNVTQDGTVLTVEQSRVMALYEAQTVSLPVSSNGEWFVEKEQELLTWFDFEQTDFDGDGEVKITLGENSSTSTRSATIYLSTIIVEGADPVVKEVTIYQAYQPTTTRNEFTPEYFNSTYSLQNGSMDNMSASGTVATFLGGGGTANRVTAYSQPLGRYTFCLKALGSTAVPSVLFYGTGLELNATVSATTTNFTCVGLSDITQAACDMTVENEVGVEFSQNFDTGLTDVEWFLNGESIHKYIATSDGGFAYTWGTAIPQLIFGNATWGSAQLDAVEFYWMEYTAPIEWGF